MSNTKKELTGVAALLLAALIWGAAFTAQSIGAEYVPPFTFLASRSWIGTAVLIPIMFFLNRRDRQKSREGSDKKLSEISRPRGG